MKKRLASFLCALLLVVSAIPAASALEGEAARAADTLSTLGLIDAAYDLDATATRSQAAVLLATAPKSNSVYQGIAAAMADVKAGRVGDIPRELQNVHADSAGLEREQGSLYPHDFPGHWVRQQYLPDELKNRKYYQYGDNKTEQAARRYWDEIKKP